MLPRHNVDLLPMVLPSSGKRMDSSIASMVPARRTAAREIQSMCSRTSLVSKYARAR